MQHNAIRESTTGTHTHTHTIKQDLKLQLVLESGGVGINS